MNLKKQKHLRKAFTLAEVLITLGIIGVVAAMTLPTLIAKYQEQVTVNHLLKTYSMLSQAVQRMQTDYGTIDTWGLEDTSTGLTDPETGEKIYNLSAQRIMAERLKPYLKVVKSCELNEICLNAPSYALSGDKLWDPAPLTSSADSPPEGSFFLADGTYISIEWFSTFYKRFDIQIVLPPYNKTSTRGKNNFYFIINKNGLYPEGTMDDTGTPFTKCDPNYTPQRDSGRGCTAWVIYNKNMDYLHCREKLGWDKKRSCKE